jgi:hypothetical protein
MADVVVVAQQAHFGPAAIEEIGDWAEFRGEMRQSVHEVPAPKFTEIARKELM